jgi:hypothetical protein
MQNLNAHWFQRLLISAYRPLAAGLFFFGASSAGVGSRANKHHIPSEWHITHPSIG